MSAPTKTLRDALDELIGDITDIDALLFTTFGLSVEFFEDCVLGTLAFDEPRLSSAHDVFGASEYCDDVNLGIFYDANITEAVDKRVSFQSFPVFVDDGAFHPKVIVASGDVDGERVIRLLVGSANLSLAGWAHNREIYATVDVDDAATAAPLLALLEYLFETQPQRNTELRDQYQHLLDALADRAARREDPDGPRLHVTIPDQTNSLMQYLVDSNPESLTVYSPYFGERPLDFLEAACPNGPITVIAAQDKEGRLALPETQVADVLESESSAIELARLPASDGDDEYRFDHFKAYHWSDSLLVGSHNSTEAALGRPDGTGHRNVEVSVELTGVSPPDTAPFSEPPRGTPKEDLTPPEELFKNKMPASISVTANWRKECYLIELGAPIPDSVIDLPGIDKNPALVDQTMTVPFSDRSRVELLEQKWFDVYRRQSTHQRVYRGLINETDWRTYRREAVLDSLTACFDAWVTGTVDDPTGHEDHLVPASERLLNDSEQRVQPLQPGPIEDDLFENYFRFFRASQRYRQRVDAAIDNDDVTTAVRLLVSAPGSLQRVLELTEERIEDEGDQFWSVYRFVLVHELARFLDALQSDAGDLDEIQGVIDRLQPRVQALKERFRNHRAWRDVRADDDIRTATRFVLREMGYLDD